MAKARKTTQVSEILNYANEQLKRTDEFATQKFKAGICTLVERILMDTKNYNGYRYLHKGEWQRNEFSREYYAK